MNSNQQQPFYRARFRINSVIILVLALLSACNDDGDGYKFVEAIEADKLGISGIRIETNNPVINADGTAQYFAFGIPTVTTSSEPDITDQVRWRVSDTTLASINDVGLLTAKADGDLTVIAEFSTYSANVTQLINTANLIGLNITGISAVDECRDLQLDAEGEFDDGTIRPISDLVTWSVTSGEANITADGLLQTAAAGSVTVLAESGGITGDATVNVNDTLQSITLSPLNPSIEDGDTLRFTATGAYATVSDDISDNSTWTSDNTSVAAFNDATEIELITGIAPGTAVISAACGGVTAATLVTVTERVLLQFVEINNGDGSVTVSETDTSLQLDLTAEFNDGSRSIVTEDAGWSIDSQSGTNLVISDESGSKGEITIGSGTGTATIRAEYEGESDTINVIVE